MNISNLLRSLLFVLLITFASNLSAQDKVEITEADYGNTKVEMADTMRSNGKIYVVVAVIITIFAGMVFYTFTIDRKIKKLEEKEND